VIYKINLVCPKCKSKFYIETDNLNWAKKVKNAIYCTNCKVNLQIDETNINKKDVIKSLNIGME
jgi:predicted Zn finger-like uncharacterized protein